MDRFTYRELVNGLAEVDAWLCSQGLTQQRDRMRINKLSLEFLARAVDDGTLDRAMEEASGERRRELMWPLAESTEFVDSLKSLRGRGCDIPIHVLKRALDGPGTPQGPQARIARPQICAGGIGVNAPSIAPAANSA